MDLRERKEWRRRRRRRRFSSPIRRPADEWLACSIIVSKQRPCPLVARRANLWPSSMVNGPARQRWRNNWLGRQEKVIIVVVVRPASCWLARGQPVDVSTAPDAGGDGNGNVAATTRSRGLDSIRFKPIGRQQQRAAWAKRPRATSGPIWRPVVASGGLIIRPSGGAGKG